SRLLAGTLATAARHGGRAARRGGAVAPPFAGARTHPRVSAPPSSGCAAAPGKPAARRRPLFSLPRRREDDRWWHDSRARRRRPAAAVGIFDANENIQLPQAPSHHRAAPIDASRGVLSDDLI
ncbi:Os05g0114800, partial [Oryza sativa Japonica Group]